MGICRSFIPREWEFVGHEMVINSSLMGKIPEAILGHFAQGCRFGALPHGAAAGTAAPRCLARLCRLPAGQSLVDDLMTVTWLKLHGGIIMGDLTIVMCIYIYVLYIYIYVVKSG